MLLQLAAVAVKPLWKKILPSPLFLMNFIPISSFYFFNSLCQFTTLWISACPSPPLVSRWHRRPCLIVLRQTEDGWYSPSVTQRALLPTCWGAAAVCRCWNDKKQACIFGKSAVEVWISFVGFMKHKKETTRSAQKRVVSAFTATTLESGGLFFLSFLFYFCSIPVFP